MRRIRPGPAGFSLVELLVAALFLGLLMAGMAQVLLACLRHGSRVERTLAAQRALRWAVARITEDTLMLGSRCPPPEPGAAGGPPPWGPGLAADEWTFTLDVPIPVPAVLAAALGPGAADPRLRCAARVELGAGDRLVFLDGPLEWAPVRRPVALAAGAAAPVPAGPFRFPHAAGARVHLVRPRRAVRYAVVPLALDPASPGELSPCLVRFEAPLPADGSPPRWDPLLERRPGPRGGSEVVAGPVTRFRVEWAPELRLVRILLATGGPPGGGSAAQALTLELAPRSAGLDGAAR